MGFRLPIRLSFVVFLAAFWGYSAAWATLDCHKLSSIEINECNLELKSKYLKGPVYIKAWSPINVTEQTPVILFFHGRGYSLPANSPKPTMIEAAGLKQWMQSDEFKKSPAVILSPQDLFTREDGTGKGNDYWIGAEGRNWEGFIINELKPLITSELSFSSQKKWLTAGISMGAHGSMKMSLDYPDHFKAFVALSPVFRSTSSEIEDIDAPVFYQYDDLTKTNIGARLITNPNAFENLDHIKHWIEIHDKDFALNDNFQNSKLIWNTLSQEDSSNAVFPINSVKLHQPGHSMEFWQNRLPLALTWLINQ